MWPEYADGTDINAVCRNAESSLLASGDDFGKVKIFLYPATQPKVRLILNLFYFFCCAYAIGLQNGLIELGFVSFSFIYRVYHIHMAVTAVM